MIKHQTVLLTPDNAGSVFTKCVRIHQRSMRRGVLPGQTCVAVIKKIWAKKLVRVKKSKLLERGQVCRVLILRNARGIKRWGNFYIHAQTNSAVILTQYDYAYATRMKGVAFKEIGLGRKFKEIVKMVDYIL